MRPLQHRVREHSRAVQHATQRLEAQVKHMAARIRNIECKQSANSMLNRLSGVPNDSFRSTANFQLLMLRFICLRTCSLIVDASEIDDRFFNSSGILTCRRRCNFVPRGFLDFRFLPLI